LGDESVLAEEFEVVGFGDWDEVSELGLNLTVPVLVIVEPFRVKILAEEGAAGADDLSGVVGFDGEDVA